uniref:Putative secreted protein n=1 Tax=Ixodes ricinus TaxID=34613 RepID=A0A6B0UPM5_IXORI
MEIMSAMVLFSLFVSPLVWGWYAVVRRWLVWLRRRISCVSWAMNDDPRSLMRISGAPCRRTMDSMKNLATSTAVPDGSALVSAYHVRESVATIFHRFPCVNVGNSPSKSIPICWNGAGGGAIG